MRQQRAPAGFTLLEMLVALVVIAIGLSVATLAVRPDPRRPLALEAERLALLLTQAGEEAELSGTPMAWVWQADGYAFQRRELTDRGAEWQSLDEDELFRARRLGEGARIDIVRADGSLLPAGARIPLRGEAAADLSLELSLEDARLRIEAAPDGRGYRVAAVAGGG